VSDTVVTAVDALHHLCLADPVWSERYEGWTELGRGGSASVVRTFSRATGEDIALKVFHHLLPEDEQRFRQEVRSAQRLTSPHIVRTYGAFPRGRLAWIEMELVHGPDLRHELDRRAQAAAPFDAAEGLAIGLAIGQALVAAHEGGVVHRDVKPGNVLLPESGKPIAKLGDFGLSRIAGSTRVTATGLLAGTPQFVAPEIVAGRPATAAADVYSLALTLYLVFSGNRSPYEIGPESSPAEWLRAHSEARPRPLRDRAPLAPADVAYLLAVGMSKDPAARPTAAHFVRELRGMASGAVTTGRMASRGRAPRRWLVLAGAAGVALAAVVLARATLEPEAPLPPVALRSPDVPSLVPFPVPTPPPLILMHGSVATPEPSPAPRATPAFRVGLTDGMLTILNASHEDERDLRITLRDAAGHTHRATAAGVLAPGEEMMVALDSFDPPPPIGFRPAHIGVRPRGAAAEVSVTP
jgi:eukaryotic-like serine/threonine-protein kinase